MRRKVTARRKTRQGKQRRAKGAGGKGRILEEGERVVVGSPVLPRGLVDTAHLSILNAAVKEDGLISDVGLRLGGVPPGNGQWEVRSYSMGTDGAFCLEAARRFQIDALAVQVKQTLPVTPPLPISRGQFIGICNPSGRISLAYRPGWVVSSRARNDPFDLWYCNHPPPDRVGSTTAPTGQPGELLRWNGVVGWHAITHQCE